MAILLTLTLVTASCVGADKPALWPHSSWQRHTIDDSSIGTDGTRFGDLNGDGLLDITTPWEQDGQVRVSINPGNDGLKYTWPRITVGEIGDPEDVFFWISMVMVIRMW